MFCSFPSAVAATVGAAVVVATIGAAVAAAVGAAVAALGGAAVAALGGAAVVVLGIAVDATVVGVVVAFSPAGGTSGTVKASALLPFAACGKNFNV